MDRVDVEETLRRGDEGEVDGVGRDPNSPRSHDGRLEIGLELGNILIPALPLNGVEVSKELRAIDDEKASKMRQSCCKKSDTKDKIRAHAASRDERDLTMHPKMGFHIV